MASRTLRTSINLAKPRQSRCWAARKGSNATMAPVPRTRSAPGHPTPWGPAFGALALTLVALAALCGVFYSLQGVVDQHAASGASPERTKPGLLWPEARRAIPIRIGDLVGDQTDEAVGLGEVVEQIDATTFRVRFRGSERVLRGYELKRKRPEEPKDDPERDDAE
jgi:hypothetical protein